MWIDPFRLCVALLPLAVYFLLLGLINLSRRPLLTTGARDLGALGVAVSGTIIVGPLELFMPEVAAARFHANVWLLLVAFYSLCLTLLVLLSRPRLVIYNISSEQLRPVLAEVVTDLDGEARWAGDSLVLPRLGVQLHLDSFPIMRNVSLNSIGKKQSFDGWRRLEANLAVALGKIQFQPNPRGVLLISVSILMVAGCLVYMLNDPQAVAHGWHDLIQR